jgi:hypothetical protein
MELAYSLKNKKSPNSEHTYFKRYKNIIEIHKDRPLTFIFEGNFSKDSSPANYTIVEKSESYSFGIRRDLEVLGFSTDMFLKLCQIEKFSEDLIKDEINNLIISDEGDSPFSREDEIEILSEFFEI